MSKTIVFLVFPGFQLLDLAGPIAAFEIANRIVTYSYDMRVVFKEPDSITSSCGVQVVTSRLPRPSAIDTLIVTGGAGVRDAMSCKRLLTFILKTYETARRTTSVCSGAYLLAATGILNGRHATTHWGNVHDFETRFPDVFVEPDRLFVRDNNVWTSAGITAGIDLSIALIAEDLGEEVTRHIARQLVIEHRRTGSQSQFSALLEMDRPYGRFFGLLDYARTHLADKLDVGSLASMARMSERNFSRAFKQETGTTPAKALERLRVEAARAALRSGEGQAQEIARSCGFRDGEHMRRAFVRVFGTTPSEHKHSDI